MAEKTRTVTLWYNEDRARLTLAVNPRQMTVVRTQAVRSFRTIGGDPVQVVQGSGPRQVRFETFLPGHTSPFYTGTPPRLALALLHHWQHSRHPVRLVVSDTDLNGLFLLTRVGETITEGDRDIGISLELTEIGAALPRPGNRSGALALRPDERIIPGTYTVRPGDTLWSIARRLWQDGSRWRKLAEKNGMEADGALQTGQVLIL